MTAARLYRFSAVHSLDGFPEPWCNQHGHHYTIELVGDFNHEQADGRWESIRHVYEWADLNEIVGVTTVEVLAAYFAQEFGIDGIRQVTVWEDDTRWGRCDSSSS